jgi:hypothetical protein
MVRVIDLDNGLFDVVDCDSGVRHHVALVDLPDTLISLGVKPREWDEARRPLSRHETEMLVMILVGLWQGLDRDLSRRAAERWIAKHLTPSKRPHPLGIHWLRSLVEHESHRYVPATVMRAALEAKGIKVGERVYAKEVK